MLGKNMSSFSIHTYIFNILKAGENEEEKNSPSKLLAFMAEKVPTV
jgi:hypothetical protein